MLLQSIIYRFLVITTLLTSVSAHAWIINKASYTTASAIYQSITPGYLLLAMATLNKDFRNTLSEGEKSEYNSDVILPPSNLSPSLSKTQCHGFDGDPDGKPSSLTCLPFILNDSFMVTNNRSSTVTVFMLHGANNGEEEMEVDDDPQPSTSQGATSATYNQGAGRAETYFRDMSRYEDRLASFNSELIRRQVETYTSPQLLAQSGFYYMDESSLPEQMSFDLALALRVNNYPSPPSSQGTNDFALVDTRINLDGWEQVARKAGFNRVPEFLATMGLCHYQGRHPGFMCTIEERLATFADWPAHASVPAQQLAEAGLFYTHSGDSTVFFGCNHGGLCNWQPGDDPWEEHAHFFPECPVLKVQKSKEEIKKLAKSREKKYEANNHPLTQSLLAEGFSITAIQRAYQSHTFFYDFGLGLDEIAGNQDFYNSLTEWIRKEEKAMSEARANQASTSSYTPAAGSTEVICCCCLNNPCDIYFIPCGHFVCCKSCSPRVNSCPVCRISINQRAQSKAVPPSLCPKCQERRPNILYIPCTHLMYCDQCNPKEDICPVCKEKVTHKQRIFQEEK